jgi:hypothetical protein
MKLNDITVLFENHPLREVQEITTEFEQQCVLTASERLINILLQDIDIIGTTEEARKMYSAILQSRDKGITQVELSVKLNTDPKTTFHHIKRIKKLGTVQLIPWKFQSNVTKLLIHQRFLHQSDAYRAHIEGKSDKNAGTNDKDRLYLPFEMLVDRLDEMLSSAHNHILVKLDILNALELKTKSMRKSFNSVIRKLVELGCIQIVKVRMNDRTNTCIQAHVRFSSDTLKNVEKIDFDGKRVARSISLHQSIERQVYNAILSSGLEGITRIQLQTELEWVDRKGLLRILDSLSSTKGGLGLVKAVPKLKGKTRYILYVAKDAIPFKDTPVPKMENFDINFNANSEVNVAEPSSSTQAQIFQADAMPICVFCKKEVVLPNLCFGECCSLSCQRDLEDTKIWERSAKGKQGAKFLVEHVRRDRVLLEIINEKKVVEVNSQLLSDFQNLLRHYHPSSQPLISDFKTLRKCVWKLQESGKIGSFYSSIKNLNGSLKQILVALEKNIDSESELVKDFLKETQHNWLFSVKSDKSSNPVMYTNAPKIDIEVHRLGQKNEDEMDDDPGFSLKGTLAETDNTNKENPYGYLRASNSRLKEIHWFIFSLSLVTEDGIISPEMIFPIIPVYVVLRVFDLKESEALNEFLSGPSSSDLSFLEVPENIREIIPRSFRVKNFFMECIAKLVELEFLEPLRYDDESGQYVRQDSFAPYYRVNRTIELKQYEKNPPVYLETVTIVDEGSFNHLWDLLENRCLSLVDLKKSGYANIQCQNRFQYLFRSHCWKSKFTFTSEQKAALSKYVEKETGCTPLKNNNLCLTLSQQLNIPVFRVKYYFTRVEQLYSTRRKRKHTEPEQNNIPRQLSSIRTKGQRLEGEGTPNKKRKTLEFRPRRRWNAEEDELLLVADVVISQYLEQGRRSNMWFPSLFPELDFERDHYRRRVFVLKRNPDTAKVYSRFKNNWDSFKTYAVENGISLERNNVSNNFAAIVREFHSFTKSIELSRQNDLHTLGFDLASIELEEMNQRYSFTSSIPPHSTSQFLVMNLEKCSSRQSKIAHLNGVSFTITLEPGKVEAVNTKENINLMKAVTLIKVLLMTPREKYDPSLGWNLLTTFEEGVIEKAIQQLCRVGTTSKSSSMTKTTERKIPGRAYHLSNQFWETFGGPLSAKLGVQALKFWKSLVSDFHQQSHSDLPLLKSDGIMSVLLELLSTPSYSLGHDMDMEEEEVFTPSPMKLVRWDTSAILSRQNSFEGPEPNLEGGQSEIIDSIARHIQLPRKTVKGILKYIENVKEIGFCFDEIACLLPEETPLLNVSSLINLLIKARQIERVGYHDVRYIHPDYKSVWSLHLPLETEQVDLMPMIWNTMRGVKTDSVYRMCFDSVLSRILTNPGISKVYEPYVG